MNMFSVLVWLHSEHVFLSFLFWLLEGAWKQQAKVFKCHWFSFELEIQPFFFCFQVGYYWMFNTKILFFLKNLNAVWYVDEVSTLSWIIVQTVYFDCNGFDLMNSSSSLFPHFLSEATVCFFHTSFTLCAIFFMLICVAYHGMYSVYCII